MERPIGCIGVVGAGTMGAGIAQVALAAGYEVRLHDVLGRALEGARGRIEDGLVRWARKGTFGLSEERVRRLMAQRLLTTTSLTEAVGPADLVIEAVPENPQLKTGLFRELGRLCQPDTILSSNTSTIRIATLAEQVPGPHRVAGMHFSNPVPLMPLVELVRIEQTSEETIETLRSVAAQMGKETIVVKDSPGFATSRLGVVLGNEAMRMVEQGVASPEDIDKGMRLMYGHKMGPLETADLVGLDVRLSNAEYLYQALGDPQFKPPEILRKLVASGRLGRKTGQGFYAYDAGDSAGR